MRLALLATAAAVLATAAPASAAPILGLYSTGTDDAGNVLAPGTKDPHYLLDNGEARSNGPFVYANSNYFTPGDAAYIAFAANGSFGTRSATHDYTLTFDLTGYDPATARITGRFGADDTATIFLNNVSTGITAPTFTSLTGFDLTSGFIAGVNTLTFRLTDTGGVPSALFVDRMEGSVQPAATAVPELATWGMMIAGFGLIGAAARRRRTVSVRFA